MGLVLTNLSNRLYENSRHRLNASAARFGIDTLRSYDFETIRSTDFYRDNRGILDQPTGMGYWLWKPYIIWEALNSVAEGDIVIYADSGLEIMASVDPLLDLCRNENPVLLFGNGNFSNAQWTKRDCFALMDCDHPYYWKAPQCDAAFCLFQRSETSLRFVGEWLRFCRDPRIITDAPNTSGLTDLPDFIEHRHDQSVLSLMAARHRLSLFRMPSQFGNHYKIPALRVEGEFNCINQYHQRPVDYYAVIPYSNSPYGQLLDHHRGQNSDAAGPVSKKNGFQKAGRIIAKHWLRWKRASALRKETRPAHQGLPDGNTRNDKPHPNP
jgi:hypothetical protein